ncbi:MAG: SDR family oxidoreductase, partial [Rhodospirillaceae bacterium]|nr:SDR family oxidoreductase [Rhodospirillaceae bacterium]
HVVACDIDGDELEKTVSGLEGEGHLAIACDLSQPENCESLVAQTLERHGRLDILVNVAGIIERIELDEVDEAAWARTMDVNVKSQFFLCRAASEPMKKAHWGRIVNFTSQAAHTGGFYGTSVYAVSKGGVVSLTKNFARLLGPDNITVNAIAPALVDTRMVSGNMTEEAIDNVTSAMPIGRMTDAAEIAMSVAFLASESAATITGHTLDINGGLLMR